MASTPLSALRKLEPYSGLLGFLLIFFVAVIAVLMVILKVRLAWFILPLAAWAGILLLRPSLPDAKRLALFLVGTGLVLTLTVEVVVLRGDIARMNTVFKFYLQVWTLFAVSAAAGLGWLLPNLRLWLPRWRVAWQVVLALLIIGAGAYTFTASLAKVRDRMSAQAPHNLDGMLYMPYSSYNWKDATMDLSQDYRAIRWMQENVVGSPVIVEANSGDLYRWYTRYTINTGLPNPLGWEWHQIQQRALNPSEWVHQRLEDINEFYLTTDSGITSDFLQKYGVRYIILGQLEKITYPGPGLDKFAAFNGVMWNEVYRDLETVIYEVIGE
jgi:uncharacterized membrane protein